jgi:hypothetical protein
MAVNQWRRVARRVKNKEFKATVVYETNVWGKEFTKQTLYPV